jgi:Phytanoyl-CoA dioxygenase (PhyH)
MAELTTEMLADCRRALDDDGYVVLRGVVSKERLADFGRTIFDEFDRQNAAGALFEGGGLISGHLNCVPGSTARFAFDDIVDGGIVELVRSVSPAWADRPRATMNFNLPGSHAQHYHMDGVYTADFLICNIAVVDTDLVNGALDVLPGTHKRFYRFYQYALQRKFRLSTRVPLQQGDVVVRRSTLWHRGMPNRSTKPRPMLAFTFGEMAEPVADPFATNDGRIEFYPNWFRPTALGRLRERTFVTAPITYSAFRFARSLISDKGYSS